MAGLRPTIAGLFPAPEFTVPGLPGLDGVRPVTDSFGRATNWFFDRETVTNRLPALKLKVLSRMGAITMRDARKSIKTREGPSSPGTPPNAHLYYRKVSRTAAGTWQVSKRRFFFRDAILFAFDPFRETAVVGPYLFNGARTHPTMPEVQEFGGTVAADGRVITVANAPGRDAKGRYTSNGTRQVTLTGTLRYPARPYMRPALQRTQSKFAGLFRDAL